ncbi:MAG TPA: Gmad2 immunoglobulin-like domain-containing protein [Mycobacteriales bacterium]|nr:Gmad2 immunoglobulin-like domain-containing protein [Mycobacteriales bacterium]
MSTDDREMERLLREALATEADMVHPEGDGLMRIQQRIGARNRQRRWLRPVLVLGSVVVVAVVAVGGVTIARHGDKAKVSPTNPGTGSDAFPAQGIFPFTTAAEEADWEQQYADGHSPWPSDPEAVATSWVPNYLKAKDVDQLVSKEQTATVADVTLGRDQSEGGLQPVVVVHLVKFHQAWIVTGASDPTDQLRISTPGAGDTVSSPLTVSGPGFGVDEVAKVELRDAETPSLIATAPTDGFGSGTSEWSTTLSFSQPQSAAGVVVAMTMSAADGGIAKLAAEKVDFGAAPPPSAGAAFYGVQGGVIEAFNESGRPEGPVALAGDEGTVMEVHKVGGRLYFTARTGDCITSLYSVAATGGTPAAVATADRDYGIVGFDVSTDGKQVTYFESSGCNQSEAGMGRLVFANLAEGTTRHIDFPSEPPVIVGDPVWEPDGVHVDAFVRTGMQGYLARYDATHGDNETPSHYACGEFDPATQLTGALTTDADGTLWFAGQTGSSMQVLSCKDGQPNVELTIPVNGSPTSLAVDLSGDILLTGSDGKVWLGSAGKTPAELPAGARVSSVTW